MKNSSKSLNQGSAITNTAPIIANTWEVNTNPKRILVIDSDESFLFMVERVLSDIGHEVRTYPSFAFCEKILGQGLIYDVMLIDEKIISLSNKIVLKKIKQISRPIVLMSSRSKLTSAGVKRAGFDILLKKPITMPSLQNLFGTNKEAIPFPPLEELFGEDKKTICKIITTFIRDTNNRIVLLEKAIIENGFAEAQLICYKMYPMFMQLGAKEIVEGLLKIKGFRKEKDTTPLWKKNAIDLICMIKPFLVEIENKYDRLQQHLKIDRIND